MDRIGHKIRQLFNVRRSRRPVFSFPELFRKFQEILAINNRVLELIAEANDKLGGNYIFDGQYIHSMSNEITELVRQLIFNLDLLTPDRHHGLHDAFRRIHGEIEEILAGRVSLASEELVLHNDLVGRDDAEIVGGKSANLTELYRFLGIRIPDGFTITTAAFRLFLKENRLTARIEERMTAWRRKKLETSRLAAEVQEWILAGHLPSRLNTAIAHALEKMAHGSPLKNLYLAARSSAWGEDGIASFAGQHMTLLQVEGLGYADWYKQIIASTYSAGALEYRRLQGLENDAVLMAVACQRMVDAKASGILYSLDPLYPTPKRMLITSIWGLGGPAVSGTVKTDRFVIKRYPPFRTTEISVVHKPSALTAKKMGGTQTGLVPEEAQGQPSLSSDQVKKLAAIGIQAERYFKTPQDMEFAVNQEGDIIILQTRPLRITQKSVARSGEHMARIINRSVRLLRNSGEVAQGGVASGAVCFVKEDQDLDRFPLGAILVSKYASPRMARALPRAAGILTEMGSAMGHLATIAREFRIPAILNIGPSLNQLVPGQEITVDADDHTVYEGIIEELLDFGHATMDMENTSEYKLLRRILKRIEPLHLLDPTEKNFTPAACRTLHDITRFVHEKAVEALINLNYGQSQLFHEKSARLQWTIPLDLVIIDIGDGLKGQLPSTGTVTIEQINSAPMQSLLQGLVAPGAWENSPAPIDFGSFMSSMTKTFPNEQGDPRFTGLNLAVISKNYSNVSLRLGYHYTVIDSYLSENLVDNYIYFRFFGGVTEAKRRSRRAEFLGTVLSQNDFRVTVQGDLAIARIKRFDARSMAQRLFLLGVLIGFSRQLDVRMNNDGSVNEYARQFNSIIGAQHDDQT